MSNTLTFATKSLPESHRTATVLSVGFLAKDRRPPIWLPEGVLRHLKAFYT